MSAPILPTKAPKAEGLSRSEDAEITPDRPLNRAESFANAIEQGLNSRERLEKSGPRDLDSEPAAGLPRGGTTQTPNGSPFPQGKPLPTESDQDLDQDTQSVPPALSPSDRGYHALRVLVAASGKTSPKTESAGEKPTLYFFTPSPPDASAPGEADSEAARPDRGLDTGVDEVEDNEVSGDELAKLARAENAANVTQTPTDSVASAILGSITQAPPEAAGPDGDAPTALADGVGMKATKEDADATRVDLEGLPEAGRKTHMTDAIRMSTNEQSTHREQLATVKERDHNPLPAPSERHADALHEIASAVGRGAQSPSASTPSPTAPTQTPPTVSGAELPEGLSNQIRWMLNRRSPVAELKLNPAELGSMEIRIALDKETTHIQFLVQNAATKEMVEDALPRLRALLSGVGVNLQDVSVKEQTAGEHRHNAHSGFAEGDGEGRGYFREEAGEELTAPSITVIDRIVDAYV